MISTVNTDTQAGTLSTNCAISYFRSNLYGTENQLNANTGLYEDLMDFMNYDYTSALVQSGSSGSVVWNGTTPITTIAYNTYGNTTVYHIILAWNGYDSPIDIPNGTTLELPSLSLVNSLLSSTVDGNSQIGQTVSI